MYDSHMPLRDAGPAIRELLEWIDARPRTYRETMEAWRSTCPRHTVWEDASIQGLLAVEEDGDEERVRLTDRGREALAAPD